MTVDKCKVGKDSDYCGVEALPRSKLVLEGSRLRKKVLSSYSLILDWDNLCKSREGSQVNLCP